MTDNALQTGQTRGQALMQTLRGNHEEILQLVGGDAGRAKRLIHSAYIVACEDEYVMACSPGSIMKSVLQAAMVGADLAKGTGDGFIVPFKGQATFLDGYKLWQRKMAEAGYDVDSQVVRAQDDFTYVASPMRLHHAYDPFDTVEDRGGIRGAYAAAYRVSAGGERVLVNVVVASMEELTKSREAAKSRNRGRESPAWKLWGDQMYLRLPIKRLAKKLDLRESSGLQKLLEIDAQDGGADPDLDRMEDIEVKPAPDLNAGRHVSFGFTPAPESTAEELSKELGHGEPLGADGEPLPDWDEAERQAQASRPREPGQEG